MPLSCFLKQDAFVYIVIVYLFYYKNAYQKKKNSHPSILGQLDVCFFQRLDAMIAVARKRKILINCKVSSEFEF